MLALLLRYLSINTAAPNPDYESVIKLFTQQACADGFVNQAVTLPSGNPVLVISYGGTSNLPAVVFNHHMDVVPAENFKEWICNPFQPKMVGNQIFGRGTQDMKAVGIAHYMALKKLKAEGFKPKRSVHLLFVPDEERGGFHGTKEFIQHHIFSKLNIGYVVDEGMPSGSSTELLIKTEERTPIQIRIVSKGAMGHASVLFNDNCTHGLVEFLHELTSFQKAQREQTNKYQPGKLISTHITSLRTNSSSLNVIPSLAEATVDIRVPAQYSLEEVKLHIQSLANKYRSISWEVLATSEERMTPLSLESGLYRTLCRVVQDHGYIPKPFAFEATTDLRFYSSLGIEGVGLTPFTIAPNLHGTNESIYVSDLVLATNIFYNFLIKFSL
ncbi:MAG TPA: M20/M25/M40 family metallo-hydrolase [Candidatus Babeliaceae bacterium]|nr:M20/M25/M40 family metallo-hydrolase [Candidatus Babeliaceae bacterium]